MHISPDLVAQLGPDGFIGDGPFPDVPKDTLADLLGPRATARRISGWIFCAAPLSDGSMRVHGYKSLPKNTALADLIHKVEAEVAQTIPVAPRQQPQQQAEIGDKFKAASLFLASLPIKKRLPQLLFALRDQGLGGIVALGHIRQGRVHKTYFATRQDRKINDDFKTLIKQRKDDSLDLDLTARKLGGEKGTIFLPEDPDNGLAFFGVDLTPAVHSGLNDARDHFHLLTDVRPPRKYRRMLALTAAVCAVALYLMLPAPVYVSNFAEARASQSITMALPFGAFLEQTHVRPGQFLAEGEIAAVLRSPDIENGIAEQKVAFGLEQINGQDALNNGDIGALQLSEKRAEIALLRQKQLESRQALLTVTAPVASRVVTAIPDGDRGNFLPIGTAIVTLQPLQTFDLMIDIAPQDSARVQSGQTGHVFFRGLSDATYAFETLSEPFQVIAPDTGEQRSQVRARLMAEHQSDLLVGLSGYARINTRTAPRIVGLTRPIADYLRLQLWKHLGFTI